MWDYSSLEAAPVGDDEGKVTCGHEYFHSRMSGAGLQVSENGDASDSSIKSLSAPIIEASIGLLSPTQAWGEFGGATSG